MNIEELESEWAADAHINTSDLADESAKIPKLHAKYYKFYIREKISLNKINQDITDLRHLLTRFYAKDLTIDELQEYNLTYPDVKIMKSDIDRWVETHSEMVELKKKSGTKLEKIDFLKSILNQINNRSFQINNSIKFIMFQNGE